MKAAIFVGLGIGLAAAGGLAAEMPNAKQGIEVAAGAPTSYSGAGLDAGGRSFRFTHPLIAARVATQPNPVLGTGSQFLSPALGGPSIRPLNPGK
jgi:hypothetical protein